MHCLILTVALVAALNPLTYSIPIKHTLPVDGTADATSGRPQPRSPPPPREFLPLSPHARGAAAVDSEISLSATLGKKGFRTFVDAQGRERVFHGVNAVVKGAPWLPSGGDFDVYTSLGPEDFSFLQDLGVNVIRLGIMWAGVEPERGQYNASYLMAAKEMAAEAAHYGIYTLLDMHQDVLSDRFCGEGVPTWAAQSAGSLAFPLPRSFAYVVGKDGFPTYKDCMKLGWPNYYLTEAASMAFQALYDNHDGLLDAWGAMWARVAQTFKGDAHVLGLELINEPWAGDVIHNPALLAPGVADKKNLQPAYHALAKAIYAEDPSRLIFFEGVTWGHVGFDAVPGGPPRAHTSVLAYHHYEIPAGPRAGNTSISDIKARVGDASRLNSGLFLTEFAEAGGGGGDIWDQVTGACDTHGQSWAMWAYKSFCVDDAPAHGEGQCGAFGCCRTGYGGHLFGNASIPPKDAQAKLARTYATAVSGEIVTSLFEPSTHVFTLTYAPNASIPLPTEIYTSDRLHYPDGVAVDITPIGAAKWQRVPNGLRVSPSAPDGGVITVTVSPVSPSRRDAAAGRPRRGKGGE